MAMEQRLISCVAYALRTSYKLDVPETTNYLKAALRCIRVRSQNEDPAMAAVQRRVISLYDSLQECQGSVSFDEQTQTDGRIYTDQECKTIAEGLLKTASEEYGKLIEKLQLGLQEREMAVRRLESTLAQEVSYLNHRIRGLEARESTISSSSASSDGQTLSQVRDSCSVCAPVHVLMEEHRLNRQALKQKRRAERLHSCESADAAEQRSVQRCQE